MSSFERVQKSARGDSCSDGPRYKIAHNLRYHTAPYVVVIQDSEDSGQSTKTVVVDRFSRALATELFPDATFTHLQNYGEAMIWDDEESYLGLQRFFGWTNTSIGARSDDDLSWKTSNPAQHAKEVKAVREATGFTELVRVANAVLARISSGEQKDASKTVEN